MLPSEWWSLRPRGSRPTDEDRDLLIALVRYEAGLCHGCGDHKDRTFDEANDGSPEADGKFFTGPPWVCFKCESLGVARESFKKELESAGSHDHGQYQFGAQLIPLRPPTT